MTTSEPQRRNKLATKNGSIHRLYEIERRLRKVYGQPRHHNPEAPLDDLVFLVLSRMTQEIKYVKAYKDLKKNFGNWRNLLNSSTKRLESVLRYAGLAKTKARQIRGILKAVNAREGRLSLACLRNLQDTEVEAYLTSLPGVSYKIARCVMLYALKRSMFPVDAHVSRIARRLGLLPLDTKRGSRRETALQDRIPLVLRSSLHVTLLAHGRQICTAHKPGCGVCPIFDLCPKHGVTNKDFPRQRTSRYQSD